MVTLQADVELHRGVGVMLGHGIIVEWRAMIEGEKVGGRARNKKGELSIARYFCRRSNSAWNGCCKSARSRVAPSAQRVPG